MIQERALTRTWIPIASLTFNLMLTPTSTWTASALLKQLNANANINDLHTRARAHAHTHTHTHTHYAGSAPNVSPGLQPILVGTTVAVLVGVGGPVTGQREAKSILLFNWVATFRTRTNVLIVNMNRPYARAMICNRVRHESRPRSWVLHIYVNLKFCGAKGRLQYHSLSLSPYIRPSSFPPSPSLFPLALTPDSPPSP